AMDRVRGTLRAPSSRRLPLTPTLSPQRGPRDASVAGAPTGRGSAPSSLHSPISNQRRKRMPPTPEQTELGYHRMWDRAQIAAAKLEGARKIARAIIANRARYAAVEQATGVPGFMIGPIHARESDMVFSTHPHTADSLKARTHHVPAGRPTRGNPPFQWDASAIDALTMAPHELQKVKAWSVERILYETEKYNGWGYLKRGNSPYLWSWTSEYHGGKYVRDGVYDPSHWDEQAGCVALLKALA